MQDMGLVMPIYTDYFKEIVKYELELQPPRIEDPEAVINSISTKVLEANNYMISYYLKHYSKDDIVNYIREVVIARSKYTKNDRAEIFKEANFNIVKWTKRDIQVLAKSCYYAVPCIDEDELKETYNILKTNERFAQYGFAINRENKKIYFVLAKPKGHRIARTRGWSFDD